MGASRLAARRDELEREPRSIECLLKLLLADLIRWTNGRLPVFARRRMDADDLVQEALIGALMHLPDLVQRDPKQVRAYVRQSIRNRIRDEIRRSALGEVAGACDDRVADARPTPLDNAIAAENERRFRGGVARLDPDDQALVVGRVDLKLTYGELARVTARPSPDAARVATRRALLRLARLVGDDV